LRLRTANAVYRIMDRTGRRRKFCYVSIRAAALLVLAGGTLITAIRAQAPPSQTTAARSTPPPSTAYAGDQACASCHDKEARTYATTPHATDSSLPTAKTVLGNFTTGQNVLATANPNLIFAMVAADNGFYESAANIHNPEHPSGEAARIDLVIGSGRRGQTYLYWKGDQLFELPVSYWAFTHQWINSPGYVDGKVDFLRPIETRCLECHVTRFDSTPPPDNRYARSSLVLGIGCERCHGPGRLHVERESGVHPPRAGSTEIAIVNPARLPLDRQLDLCALCHAGAGEPIAPSLTFQAGDSLTQFVKITAPPANTPIDVHGNQVGALEASKCFTSGKLTCSTCHNVHQTQETADAFSSHCLQCHQVQACGRYRQLGQAIRGRCVECHMPIGQSQVLTAAAQGETFHARMRTHRIAIYPGAAAAQ
jgi:hypothetical protein